MKLMKYSLIRKKLQMLSLFNKKKEKNLHFRVQCSGWLYVNLSGDLTNDIHDAKKFETLDDAIRTAKAYDRDEYFKVIENRDGKVRFYNVSEMEC